MMLYVLMFFFVFFLVKKIFYGKIAKRYYNIITIKFG